MNIVYIVSDGITEYNSSQFRVSYIADAIRRAGHKVTILNIKQWLDQSPECRVACSKADIIHLQRVLVTDTHDYIKHWTSLGKAVVADWDDAYDKILPSNAAADFWLHGKVTLEAISGFKFEKTLDVHPVEQFKQGLALCTAGITPSAMLSRDWETIAETYVVGNYIDVNYYRENKIEVDTDYITLGWGGSLSHTQSWEKSGIQDALQQILIERRDVRLFLVGDQRVVDSLPLRKDRVIFHPYVPWRDWGRILSYFDIGMAPLAGAYDDRRSSLKLTEYVSMGIPFIATRSPVYEEFIGVDSGIFVDPGDDDENFSDRTEQWYKGTISLIDGIEDYREKAERNMRIGDEWDADANVDTVIKIYDKIVRRAKQNAGKS